MDFRVIYTRFVAQAFVIFFYVARLALRQPPFQLASYLAVTFADKRLDPLACIEERGSKSENAEAARKHQASSSSLKSSNKKRGIQTVGMSPNVREKSHSLSDVRTFSICYDTLFFSINIYVLIKYTILHLLEYESFAEYRSLHCLLVGRLLLNARSSEFAKFFAPFVAFSVLRWQLEMMLRNPVFNFECIEFLCQDYNEVVKKEQNEMLRSVRLDERLCDLESVFPPPRGERSYFHGNLQSLSRGRSLSALPKWKLYPSDGPSLLAHDNKQQQQSAQHEEPLDLSEITTTNYFRRPNRSSRAWVQVSNELIRCSAFIMTAGLALMFALMIFQLPMLLTRRGFEITYSQCIDYIRAERRLLASSANRSAPTENEYRFYSMILSDQREDFMLLDRMESYDKFMLPYENFVDLNSYQVIRIASDLFDSTFILYEIYSVLVVSQAISSLITMDVILYCTHIEEILVSIFSRLQRIRAMDENQAVVDATLGQKSRVEAKDKSRDQGNRRLKIDIGQVQFMLLDLFRWISSCNTFASVATNRYMIVWFTYSALTAGWIFAPGTSKGNSDFDNYLLQTVATIFCLTFVKQFAVVRRKTRQLHSLISSCMALDNDCTRNKLKWVSVARHFHPIPLHSFRISQSTEISTLFGVKLIAWLLSAIFISSTFYYH